MRQLSSQCTGLSVRWPAYQSVRQVISQLVSESVYQPTSESVDEGPLHLIASNREDRTDPSYGPSSSAHAKAAVQYSTVQYSTVQNSLVEYSAVRRRALNNTRESLLHAVCLTDLG